MTIIFGSLLFIQDIKHQISEKKILDQQVELAEQVESLTSINANQRGVIISQKFILENREQMLQRASEIIKSQGEALHKLIEYMKRIGEWPPEFPEDNPDNWT